jgi:CRP-like cAMP-binding protein
MIHTTHNAGLFASTAEPVPMPAHNGTDTSIAAAEAIQHKINATHARILALFAAPQWREQGLTQEDVHELTGISRQTLCPRFSELEKSGRIRKTDRTRSSVGTRDCAVYEAVGAMDRGQA